MNPFEPDPTQCPECDGKRVITEHEATILPYGACPDVVKLVFVTPMRRCLSCGLIFTDHEGEKAQGDALAMYRRVLCPIPNIDKWCRANAHMLEALSPPDIVRAWQEHRARLEAGAGIEPARSGI